MTDQDFVAEFESFQEVLDGFATHLSEEGVFFENGGGGAVGSAVPFEVRIRNGFSVLRGEGEIVQATEEGVFLRLVNLDAASLKLLPKLLEHYRKRGVPLLELPEPTSEEIAQEPDESSIDAPPAVETAFEKISVEEVDDVEDLASALTLDDLEAEFLAGPGVEDSADERADQEELSEAILLDAADVGAQDAFEERIEDQQLIESSVNVSDALDSETEETIEESDETDSILVDSEELIAATAESSRASSPDDIHLDELLPEDHAEELEFAEESLTVAEAPPEDLQVDSGLPWLPDESEKTGNKGLWVILLAIIVGAILGVAFYFGYLRPRATSSWLPVEPERLETRAVPTSASLLEPAPVAATINGTATDADLGTVSTLQTTLEPLPSSLQPQSHDPPDEPLTGVDRITWADEAGETVITFWADGLFSDAQVDDFRVAGGTPREVVRVRGVQRPFPQQRIELSGVHVRQIRVGLHEELGGAALHFVADLVDGEVELSRTEAAGEQLRVYFSKAG